MAEWIGIVLLAAAQIACAVKARRDRAAVLAIMDRRHADAIDNTVAQVNLNDAVGECLRSNAEVQKLLSGRIGAIEARLAPLSLIYRNESADSAPDLQPGIVQVAPDAAAGFSVGPYPDVANLTARLKELERLVDTLVSGRLPHD